METATEQNRAIKIGQQVKLTDANSHDQSLIPKTHKIEGEDSLSQCPLTSTRASIHTHK